MMLDSSNILTLYASLQACKAVKVTAPTLMSASRSNRVRPTATQMQQHSKKPASLQGEAQCTGSVSQRETQSTGSVSRRETQSTTGSKHLVCVEVHPQVHVDATVEGTRDFVPPSPIARGVGVIPPSPRDPAKQRTGMSKEQSRASRSQIFISADLN